MTEISIVGGFLDIAVAHGAKGEVPTWRHLAAYGFLTEGIAYLSAEARKGQRIVVAVADAGIADHHQATRQNLGCLVPAFFVQGLLGHDGYLQRDGVAVLDSDVVDIQPLVLQLVGLTFLCGGTDNDALAVLSMVHIHRGGVVELHLLGESLLFLAVKNNNRYLTLTLVMIAVENLINPHLGSYLFIPFLCILVNKKDLLVTNKLPVIDSVKKGKRNKYLRLKSP